MAEGRNLEMDGITAEPAPCTSKGLDGMSCLEGASLPKDPPHSIVIKWMGKEIEIEDINVLKTVRDLKLTIQQKTGVQADRQKILNLTYKGIN